MPNIINHPCGTRTATVNAMGMREMQSRAFDSREAQYLLIKAPPASGKSRALMYIALDKIANQGLKKAIVAVPERSIGNSFKTTMLKASGFFADWLITPKYDLTSGGGGQKTAALAEFLASDEKILVCTHATLRFAYEKLGAEAFADCVVAIDEFHHTSAEAESKLGELVRGLIAAGKAHVVAMTGSYFRGDTIPVLRPEDEERFTRVTYTYYEQLSAYRYLKQLGIGYHFYDGQYITAIEEVLELSKKTIVHIPHVKSAESASKHKNDQVDELLDFIAGGDGGKADRDPTTGFYHVTRADGRVLIVADLVDDSPFRESVLKSLRDVKVRDDLDIIIALGMAKEGFDWIWCEHVLTIGYRNSMTEVIQIIGRATRDAEGKTHAQFTNLVAKPFESQETVTDAVNDMLKAISVALIMEQVLAPNFKFTTQVEGAKAQEPTPGVPIQVKGYKLPSSDRVKQIVEDQLDELKVDIFQHPLVKLALFNPDLYSPAELNTKIVPMVIANKFPDLADSQVDEVRHALLLDVAFKNAVSPEPGDPDSTGGLLETKREGENVLVKLARKFVNLNDLSIDLIDSINPFQHAYEILSKQLDESVLRAIHGSVTAARIPMTDEEAAILWPAIKGFAETHGREPNLNAQNPREERLAHALSIIRVAKRQNERAAAS
jgi:superfamily II DNA or RNA helicase